MRRLPCLASAAVGVAAASLVGGLTLLAPDLFAGDQSGARQLSALELESQPQPPASGQDQSSRGSPCSSPMNKEEKEKLWPQPKVVELKPRLDSTDEVAALEAIQIALSEVGDGSTYVWHRTGGRLSGIVRPTTSFRAGTDRVCRHMEFMLTAGTYSKKSEGIACRGADGIWSLEG